MTFPKYAAYKDSGVEWLGAVPEHWDVLKVRRITTDHRQGAYLSVMGGVF
jgi:type I restriction enzyme S subunit